MKKIIILGHENPDEDSVISGFLLQNLLNRRKLGVSFQFVIPDLIIEQEVIDICENYGLDVTRFQKEIDLSNPEQEYILVDHHDRDISGKIIAVIDHHPSFVEVKSIPHYLNQPASSTSCLICQGREDEFRREELELAMVAAMIDTASFHSTKTRKSDKDWVLSLCKKLSINYDQLYKVGLCLTPAVSIKEMSLHGLKKYNLENKHLESSYIQIESSDKNSTLINDIILILMDYVSSQNLDAFVFIVHDMTKFQSSVYQIEKGRVKTRLYPQYTSRGNTIIPDVFHDIISKNLKLFIGSSSRDSIDASYLSLAKEISLVLDCSLLFGASSRGMMGSCYREFSRRGKNIYSYTVDKYKDDLENLNSTEEYILSNTFQRTSSLYHDADVLLFLPGGTGTISEVFSMLEENRTTESPKPMILFNYQEFYTPLLNLIHTSVQQGFNDKNIFHYFSVVHTKQELFDKISSFSKEKAKKYEKSH